jgi:hypothetical protein
MFLILVGLGVVAHNHFRRDKPAAVDQPEAVEDTAMADVEAIPMPRVNQPVSLADSAVADTDNGSSTAEADGKFEDLAANDEASSDPLPFSATPLPVMEWSAKPSSGGLPSATFDSSPVSPATAASELTPLPAREPPSRSTASPEAVADEESSAWANQYDALRASLWQFKTQITRPPRDEFLDGSVPPATAYDPFSGELSRMEDTFRMLESGSTLQIPRKDEP